MYLGYSTSDEALYNDAINTAQETYNQAIANLEKDYRDE
jgi:hypothetical protein